MTLSSKTVEGEASSAAPGGRLADVLCRQPLRSGRTVIIESYADSDELSLRAPDGRLELSIVFTDKGASVSLEAADLTVTSPRDISIHCRRFEINTDEVTQLYSEDSMILLSRETILRSSDYITMNAGAIRSQGP